MFDLRELSLDGLQIIHLHCGKEKHKCSRHREIIQWLWSYDPFGTYSYGRFSGCSWRRRRSWFWFVGSLLRSDWPSDALKGWQRGTEVEGEEAPVTGKNTSWEYQNQKSVSVNVYFDCLFTAKNKLPFADVKWRKCIPYKSCSNNS